jgi:hypothetical protein
MKGHVIFMMKIGVLGPVKVATREVVWYGTVRYGTVWYGTQGMHF